MSANDYHWKYMREYFSLLEEYFLEYTGKSYKDFATIQTFSEEVHRSARSLATTGPRAHTRFIEKMSAFYARNKNSAFAAAGQLGGMKAVLSGGGSFGRTQVTTVVTTSMYCDSVLIPDPIMPWIEDERSEEKFRHVRPLSIAHALLHLKGFLNTDQSALPIYVFPSWERSLERGNEHTQRGVEALIADVISSELGVDATSMAEIIEYADRDPEVFMRKVDERNLLVAPGGQVGEPLRSALRRYEEELALWRTADWVDSYRRMPLHRQVVNGLAERIGPMYHLTENAHSLGAHPLLCLEPHQHYFAMMGKANEGRLERMGLIDKQTELLMRALRAKEMKWLADFSIEDVLRIRSESGNQEFSSLLRSATAKLSGSHLADVNRVASEICGEIDAAILRHEKECSRISEKYNRSHARTAALAVASFGGCFLPSLAPMLGVAAPFALASQYAFDKWSQLAESRSAAQSVLGILARVRVSRQST